MESQHGSAWVMAEMIDTAVGGMIGATAAGLVLLGIAIWREKRIERLSEISLLFHAQLKLIRQWDEMGQYRLNILDDAKKKAESEELKTWHLAVLRQVGRDTGVVKTEDLSFLLSKKFLDRAAEHENLFIKIEETQRAFAYFVDTRAYIDSSIVAFQDAVKIQSGSMDDAMKGKLTVQVDNAVKGEFAQLVLSIDLMDKSIDGYIMGLDETINDIATVLANVYRHKTKLERDDFNAKYSQPPNPKKLYGDMYR